VRDDSIPDLPEGSTFETMLPKYQKRTLWPWEKQ
jgi:hypothetical protein